MTSAIQDVEDDAAYFHAAVSGIGGAFRVSLYRRNLHGANDPRRWSADRGTLDGLALKVSEVGTFAIRAYIPADQGRAISEAVIAPAADRRALAASDFAPLSSKACTGNLTESPALVICRAIAGVADLSLGYRVEVLPATLAVLQEAG